MTKFKDKTINGKLAVYKDNVLVAVIRQGVIFLEGNLTKKEESDLSKYVQNKIDHHAKQIKLYQKQA